MTKNKVLIFLTTYHAHKDFVFGTTGSSIMVRHGWTTLRRWLGAWVQGSTAHPDPARAEGIPRGPRAGLLNRHISVFIFKNGTHAGNPRKMAEPE